jgi:hypothetical protein
LKNGGLADVCFADNDQFRADLGTVDRHPVTIGRLNILREQRINFLQTVSEARGGGKRGSIF